MNSINKTISTYLKMTDFDLSWEEQDLDLGLDLGLKLDTGLKLDAGLKLDTSSDLVVEEPIVVATPIVATNILEKPVNISPREFIFKIIDKSAKTYSSEKKLKHWQKTIRAIDLNRDTNISRIEAIRLILQGKAILVKATIDWKKAISPRFPEDSPILSDPTNWVIKTYQEIYAIEEKDLYRNFGIHTERTKSSYKALKR
jgi:hypothetical protein